MKKIVLLLLLANIEGLYAQKSAVQTAINFLRYDDLDKAKEAIDQASANEATITMAKTWYYRGEIYHAIYETPKEQFKSLKPGSLDDELQAYAKTIELDTKLEYTEDIDKRLYIIRSQYFNSG